MTAIVHSTPPENNIGFVFCPSGDPVALDYEGFVQRSRCMFHFIPAAGRPIQEDHYRWTSPLIFHGYVNTERLNETQCEYHPAEVLHIFGTQDEFVAHQHGSRRSIHTIWSAR